MYWLEGFNKLFGYIEDHLEDEFDYNAAADMFGYSTYHFQRLFYIITGVSLAEYIRNRRLAKAAVELQSKHSKIIDVALKYGYSSPTSFNRAFQVMHGISPSQAKKEGAQIKAYPPLFFDFTVRGAQTLDYRVIHKEAFRVVGIKLTTTTENGLSYQEIPKLWEDTLQNKKHEPILNLMNQEPYGLLGISDYDPQMSVSKFDYYIASSTSQPAPKEYTELVVPASTWAIFRCKEREAKGIQSIQQQIIMEWLPTSGYEFAQAPDVELYCPDGSVEIWLPIRSK